MCASEVEIDVLTGRTETLSSRLLFDCGKSLNPAIDIGQIEGAFVFGVGLMLYEKPSYLGFFVCWIVYWIIYLIIF